ncbi:MAG: 23S rRNA (uracil(1939)-C(5))-methyltransferase RlmD, partial [Bacteroidota bacterium]
LASKETFYYRNKLEFTFSNKRWLTEEEIQSEKDFGNRSALGFHRPGAFDKIVDVEHCHLQGDPSNAIRNEIRQYALEKGLSFYDIKSNKGFLRTLIIRTTTLNEVMVILTLGEEQEEARIKLLEHVSKKFEGKITSLNYVINTKGNDTIFDQEVVCFAGQTYITEQLGEIKYRIGPKSFFQTNPVQAKFLYDLAKSFANITSSDLVYDLYTGLGSIALYIAKEAKHVVGIEEIPEAIEYAKANASLNQIENASFYAGDVKALLTKTLIEKHGKPDVLITDPPRVGMHEEVVNMLRYLRTPKLVYVSCNAATQARDLNLLKDIYSLEKIQAVDMFPHTNHVESVALLKLKE